MNYRLTVVSDSDPSWNPQIEAWWNNGGALLWNQYGGMGTDTLVLNNEQFLSFLEEAREIAGWEATEDSCPVKIEAEEELITIDKPTAELSIDKCCAACGRQVSHVLGRFWKNQTVSVPCRELNHLINSLREAIDFIKGSGPNNYRTWEAALDEFEEMMHKR